MSGWPGLDRFLAPDPRDAGCEQALEVLHVYAEMALEDAPGLASCRHPGVAAHLAACGPCDDDFQGLLAARRDPELPPGEPLPLLAPDSEQAHQPGGPPASG